LFFALLIGLPVAHYFFSIQPTCFDGLQNQGETAVDEGGPCLKLDPNRLSPSATLWARSFKVRDGNYTAVAYVVNPNSNAGVTQVNYKFGLYDSDNVLVAERDGTTFIMPGGITPVLEANIDTGSRVAVHTYFQITDKNLDWQRVTSPAAAITITNRQVSSDSDGTPRISATVQNTSYASLHDVHFVAVVFDPNGNAIAGSGTAVSSLNPNDPQQITFTWPQAFGATVGRVDITALLPPQQSH
jgi:hypothetical protein